MPLIFNKPLVLGSKAVFNPEVFTAVGNPSITAEGILEYGNWQLGKKYVQAEISLDDAESFTLEGRFYTGNNRAYPPGRNGFLAVLSSGQEETSYQIRLYTFWQNGIFYLNINGTAYAGSADVSGADNTWYNFKIIYGGQTIKLYIDEKLSISQNIDLSGTLLNLHYITIGGDNASIYQQQIDKKYDLKTFKLTADRQQVFSGSKLTAPEWQTAPFAFDVKSINPAYEFNTDAIAAVGNITISDNGIASGFEQNTSNYVKLFDAGFMDFSLPWQIDIKVNTGSIFTLDTPHWFLSALSNSTRNIVLGIKNEENLIVYLSNNGSSFFANAVNFMINQLSNNADVYFRIIYDTEKYIFLYSLNGREFTEAGIINNALPLYNGGLKIGNNEGNGNSFKGGTIDLKSIKIISNNELIFSGKKIKE